jgi:predicted DNA-binding transcriptional regulator AlpA
MARKKPATTATTPPAAPESDRLLTRASVSEDSGFTPETLSRWHSAGYGPPAKPKRLLRRSEVSARAGFTVETLSRWAAAGHGPKCIMVGRCARYPEDEFERWIESLSASTSASE